MKIKNTICFVCFLFLLVFGLAGCSSKKTGDIISTNHMTLIYEESISPNKEYAEKAEDIVTYTVEVYQNEDYKILVNSKSNSSLFEPLQYEVECNTSIAKSDIDVEWTTLMGNSNQRENDQLSIACVSISENGTLLDKRKINFVNRGIDIIENAIVK